MKAPGVVLLYDKPVSRGVMHLPAGFGGVLKFPLSLVFTKSHARDYSGSIEAQTSKLPNYNILLAGLQFCPDRFRGSKPVYR